MLRPLSFLDQDDTETYHRMAEFGLGDNFLICPITQAEVDGRWLYLPRGTWYYFWDDTVYIGGKEVWAQAPLDRIPFFVRAGSVIPFYPVMQYVGEKEITELTLNVYYIQGSFSSTLYEDGGDGYAYEKGICNEKKFLVSGTAASLTITQEIKGIYEPTYAAYKIMVHGLPFGLETIEIDGELLTLDIDPNPELELELNKEPFPVIFVRRNFKTLNIQGIAPDIMEQETEPAAK